MQTLFDKADSTESEKDASVESVRELKLLKQASRRMGKKLLVKAQSMAVDILRVEPKSKSCAVSPLKMVRED